MDLLLSLKEANSLKPNILITALKKHFWERGIYDFVVNELYN